MPASPSFRLDRSAVLALLPRLQQGSAEAAKQMAALLQHILDEESAVDAALMQANPENIYKLAHSVQPGYQRFRLLVWIQEYEGANA